MDHLGRFGIRYMKANLDVIYSYIVRNTWNAEPL